MEVGGLGEQRLIPVCTQLCTCIAILTTVEYAARAVGLYVARAVGLYAVRALQLCTVAKFCYVAGFAEALCAGKQ